MLAMPSCRCPRPIAPDLSVEVEVAMPAEALAFMSDDMVAATSADMPSDAIWAPDMPVMPNWSTCCMPALPGSCHPLLPSPNPMVGPPPLATRAFPGPPSANRTSIHLWLMQILLALATAALAEDSLANSTNPNPRGVPVAGSRLISQPTIGPKWDKCDRNSSSPMSFKPPTNTLHGLPSFPPILPPHELIVPPAPCWSAGFAIFTSIHLPLKEWCV
mmetsp:Transcript_37887/g.104172  ORF Transcript_37887/g.104172 Transcript_37887/m.104172 type:complete len:217 (-) Transcript_37887:340-990(-)